MFLDNCVQSQVGLIRIFKVSFNKCRSFLKFLFARSSLKEPAAQEITAHSDEFSDSLHSGADKTENKTFMFFDDMVRIFCHFLWNSIKDL